jgi:hypothetical protein
MMPRSVLITGASSGIGEALAREYARRGWQLALVARRQALLESLAAELSASGAARVLVLELDLLDTHAIAPCLEEADRELGGLDLVIANAGVAESFSAGEGQITRMQRMIGVNLTGACATIDAAVAIFRRRTHAGQVVGITSMARYRGLPRLGIYSATKAGLHRYLQATRMETAPAGIRVTELAPGYIDTPMNRDIPSRPFVVSAERAARDMVELIDRGVAQAAVPRWPWTLMGRLMQILPAAILRRLT